MFQISKDAQEISNIWSEKTGVGRWFCMWTCSRCERWEFIVTVSKNAVFTTNSHDLNIRLSLTSGCSCINWTSLGDRPIYSLPVLIVLPSNINYNIKTCLWVWKCCFQRHCYKVFVIWKIQMITHEYYGKSCNSQEMC